MADYDNTNRGSIWKNEKRPGKKDPDYRIEFNLDGQDFKIAIWKRAEDANPAAPPWSFKIERPEQRGASVARVIAKKADPISSGRVTAAGGGRPTKVYDDMNDDIPF
jgi:hypothetical protein